MGKSHKRKSGKSRSKRSQSNRPHGQRREVRRPTLKITAPLPDLETLKQLVADDPDSVSAVLDLAAWYAVKGREQEIIPTLQPLEEKYPFADAGDCLAYNRLLAFGYAHTDRCIEAEDVLQRAFSDGQSSADLHFVDAYVKMTMREYDHVIEACGRYVRCLREAQEQGLTIGDIATSAAHVSQMYNILGGAYREKRQFGEATAAYNRAIQADPGNHLPYLNLAGVQSAEGDREGARGTVAAGIKVCRQAQELRLMAGTLAARSSVSACMIVKNEEELLPGCLDSIRDWVDDIVIVDTGSDDRTVEIAEQYGARIFHQEWEGNFSKHRNYSIEQANCDWVMIIDADERFVEEDVTKLRQLLNTDSISALSIDVCNVYGDGEESMSFLPSIRFFRRDTNLRYKGIVHNVLEVPPDLEIHRAGLRIKHLGYDLSKERMDQKAERTSRLLQKQLDENPDNAFALFNYAQLLTGRRKEDVTAHADRILEYAGRAIELTDPEKNPKQLNIHLMCLNQTAWTYFFTGRLDEAKRQAERALQYKPNYLDPLLLLGHIETRRECYDEAAERYQVYLDVQARYDASAEIDNMIINHVESRANALYGLAMIADLQGNRQRAIKLYRETLAAAPDYLEANAYLGRALVADGYPEQAAKHFQTQVETGQYSREAWMGLARVLQRRGDLSGAEGAYQEVLSVNPDDAEATAELGSVLQQAGRTEDAARFLSRAGELGASEVVDRVSLAQNLFGLGRYEEAMEGFRAALAERETSDIYNDLGNCHFRLKEYAQAAACYRQATAIEPTANAAYRNLGVTEACQKRYPEALEAFQAYLEREAETPDILRLVGDLQMAQGQMETALGTFERVLVGEPEDVESLYKISSCYLHMGHRDSAIMGLRRVIQLEPGHEAALQQLNELLQTADRV